ncbi:hypothetical protein B0T10DRAFT_92341 [Thelonectria olida]|uniref:Uncharacterized protein n=1 Tax=Thelonectria olida TaxID=1576542 RepID=A0A9P9AJA4_9HYPO|nr:hypothetical protein B0T10DRAFT_92341 [Thelonectria olida]
METSDLKNTASALIAPRSLIHSWNTTPFPSITLSTGGLIALADLRTVAHRTAIRGGSSWFDAVVLAPGLHHQQACDYLDNETPLDLLATPALAAAAGGQTPQYLVKNSVLANYLSRLSRSDMKQILTLDIGSTEGEWTVKKRLNALFTRAKEKVEEDHSVRLQPTLDWLSHFFYLLNPLFTISAIYFMVLFEDIWGLCLILALIVSRLLNIWAIKNRTQLPQPSASSAAGVFAQDNSVTEYTIDLGSGCTVRLRGLDADLLALTTKTWLRAQSVLDGYLEAVAKVVVYLVAALSGNMTQAGSLTLMTLLLLSAMLLGLSNAHAKGIRVGGRYATLETDRQQGGRRGDAVRYRV